MFGTTILQRKSFDPQRRMVVISDIHGNLPLFRGLLEKVAFCQEDILILLGDMLEKGNENLALLRYIMELEQEYQVYAIAGNCDAYIQRFFETSDFDESFFQNFLSHPRNQQSTLLQMGREAGLSDLKNLPLLRQTLQEKYDILYQWLAKLPTILQTDSYDFVHGGVADMTKASTMNPWDCMKNDYFYEQNHSFSKYMVVGHCPTTLYRKDYQDASPIIDHKRKIISIDGGCVLKLDGQLNALLLEGNKIRWDYYDGLPQVMALEQQSPSQSPLNIRWGRSEVEVLDDHGEFTLCRHLESGRKIEILSCFLQRKGDTITCEDSTDYLLPVKEGDMLSLSHKVEGGFLGKKDGVTGWYFGKYSDNQEKGSFLC